MTTSPENDDEAVSPDQLRFLEAIPKSGAIRIVPPFPIPKPKGPDLVPVGYVTAPALIKAMAAAFAKLCPSQIDSAALVHLAILQLGNLLCEGIEAVVSRDGLTIHHHVPSTCWLKAWEVSVDRDDLGSLGVALVLGRMTDELFGAYSGMQPIFLITIAEAVVALINPIPDLETLPDDWMVRAGEQQKAWVARPAVQVEASRRLNGSPVSSAALSRAMATMSEECGYPWKAESIAATRRSVVA